MCPILEQQKIVSDNVRKIELLILVLVLVTLFYSLNIDYSATKTKF